MLKALIVRNASPEAMVELAKGKLRSKYFVLALEGRTADTTVFS